MQLPMSAYCTVTVANRIVTPYLNSEVFHGAACNSRDMATAKCQATKLVLKSKLLSICYETK